MKAVLLSISDIKKIQGKTLEGFVYFNPIINENGDIIISEDQLNLINDPKFNFIKEKTLIEISELKKIIDTKAPKSNGTGLIVNDVFSWIFPILLNDFKIPLKTNGSVNYVEDSAISWKEFKQELKKDLNTDINNMLKPLFTYLETAEKIIL